MPLKITQFLKTNLENFSKIIFKNFSNEILYTFKSNKKQIEEIFTCKLQLQRSLTSETYFDFRNAISFDDQDMFYYSQVNEKKFKFSIISTWGYPELRQKLSKLMSVVMEAGS